MPGFALGGKRFTDAAEEKRRLRLGRELLQLTQPPDTVENPVSRIICCKPLLR